MVENFEWVLFSSVIGLRGAFFLLYSSFEHMEQRELHYGSSMIHSDYTPCTNRQYITSKPQSLCFWITPNDTPFRSHSRRASGFGTHTDGNKRHVCKNYMAPGSNLAFSLPRSVGIENPSRLERAPYVTLEVLTIHPFGINVVSHVFTEAGG